MRRRLVVGATMVSGLCISCGGATNGPKPPSAEEHANAPQACQVAKDPLNPMVVEWPAMNRADLDSVSRRGLVVVSYAGCVMKVLTNCATAGSYEFTAATPVGDTLTIDDESKLYAELPLGVASLKGELAQGRKLQLAYVAVGQRVASQAPAQLSGDCRGATHWVQTMTVGAYALDTMASSAAGGNAEVGRVQGGAQERSARARRGSSGDLEGCRAVNPNREACNAILKLGLVEIGSSVSPSHVEAATPPTPAMVGKMVEIPGAALEPAGNDNDARTARVKPFQMDATPVTVAAYDACISSGHCTKPITRPKYGSGHCNWPEKKNSPVNCVSWVQASDYCEWAGRRLPTTVEWDHVACDSESRAPVKSHPSDDYKAGNRFGVQDMAGQEWTSSIDAGYYLGIRQGWTPDDQDGLSHCDTSVTDFKPSDAEYNLTFRCAKDQP